MKKLFVILLVPFLLFNSCAKINTQPETQTLDNKISFNDEDVPVDGYLSQSEEKSYQVERVILVHQISMRFNELEMVADLQQENIDTLVRHDSLFADYVSEYLLARVQHLDHQGVNWATVTDAALAELVVGGEEESVFECELEAAGIRALIVEFGAAGMTQLTKAAIVAHISVATSYAAWLMETADFVSCLMQDPDLDIPPVISDEEPADGPESLENAKVYTRTVEQLITAAIESYNEGELDQILESSGMEVIEGYPEAEWVHGVVAAYLNFTNSAAPENNGNKLRDYIIHLYADFGLDN